MARRSLERRLAQACLGRFKPLADFERNWPKKIDRPLIERALSLDFLAEAPNCIIIGSKGLGVLSLPKAKRSPGESFADGAAEPTAPPTAFINLRLLSFISGLRAPLTPPKLH